jgi:Rieske 2Fe-2S family protein
VTLDEAAPPLEHALGEVPPWLVALGERLESGAPLLRSRRVAFDVAARWTLVLENFQESLHFATVHPALEALTPSAGAETWMPAAGEAGPWLGGLMPIVATAETVSVSGRRSGRPLLVPEPEARLVRDAIRFPNLMTSLQPDYLLTFTLFPDPADPARTRVVACTYVDADAPASSLEDVHAFWSKVYEEDREACERQELGLSSPGAKPPAWSEVEEGAAAVAVMVSAAAAPKRAHAPGGDRFAGIFGEPFLDLAPHVDTSTFPELHREITLGLARAELRYTGGTLKWMGVCAPWVTREAAWPDAMHVIRAMSREDFADFLALANYEIASFDPDPAVRANYTFGDETDHPFTRAQELFLEARGGAYFPWKACVHLLEDRGWDDKHSGEGKAFTEEGRRLFPKTVAFVEGLPMTEVGRVVIFGLLPNDHAPMHRDSEPGKSLSIAQSISFEPARSVDLRAKGFTLQTPDGSREAVVDTPIYWFNDMDWHGVPAAPAFRYSIRVDGVFDPAFLDAVRRGARRR